MIGRAEIVVRKIVERERRTQQQQSTDLHRRQCRLQWENCETDEDLQKRQRVSGGASCLRPLVPANDSRASASCRRPPGRCPPALRPGWRTL